MKPGTFVVGLCVSVALTASGQEAPTTTGLTREGNVKRVTEENRRLPLGGPAKASVTSQSGKGGAYEIGGAMSLTRGDGSQVNYLVDERWKLLGDLSVGKTVQIVPLFTNGPSGPFIQTITYVTVKVSQH